MKKIPAGTFIVPMLISAVLYTLWPNLFAIGGVTEALLGGGSINFLIGMITFSSGIGIDVSTLGKLFKRHGVIMLVKIIAAVALSLLFMSIFGQSGIFGISALAFTVVISSMNPALYMSIVQDFGDDIDPAAFGLTGLFSIPALPMIIYAIGGTGQINWLPILSTILPLILGIALGNLDNDFIDLFGGGVGLLLPVLGWNIGQGMNLVQAVQSGFVGILLALLYYLFAAGPMVATDRFLLKNNGLSAVAMNSVAGSSASFPAIVAQANPSIIEFVPSATSQILTVAIITLLVTPIIARRFYDET